MRTKSLMTSKYWGLFSLNKVSSLEFLEQKNVMITFGFHEIIWMTVKCPFLLFCPVNSTQFFKHQLQGHLLQEIQTDTQPQAALFLPLQCSIYSSCTISISCYWSYLCPSPLVNHEAILSYSFLDFFVPNMEPDTLHSYDMYFNWIECNWNAKFRTWFWIQYKPTKV